MKQNNLHLFDVVVTTSLNLAFSPLSHQPRVAGHPSVSGRVVAVAGAAGDHDGPAPHAGRQPRTLPGRQGQPPHAAHLLPPRREEDQELPGRLL